MGNLIVVLVMVGVITGVAATLIWIMNTVNKFFNKF